MKSQKMINFINTRLKTSGLSLSAEGEASVEKRWDKKESEGGYSDYWEQNPKEFVALKEK
jgi:hypothetical protein